MATKQVSVRLVASGGRQVRGELEGVGKSGAKGMQRLSREMDAANKRMAAFARRARVVAAAAAAATVAAGVAIVRNGLNVIDAQAKLAQSLDTTVASVQVLERAAELSGSKMADLEAGSARLTRRLSLFASDGSGPAAKAIERLNLNAAELLRLPLDKRIETVTNAIRDNADASEQAALFSQLFGDRGFVAFQRLDSATLRQATKDLQDFGALVSDSEADQIERTNDALSRLGLIGRGVANQIAVAAAPALETLADGLAAAAKVTGPLGELTVNTYDGRLFLKRDDGTEAIVEFVNSGRLISAGAGLSGGGSLAANRTLAADFATQAEAEAGTATNKSMNPLRVAQAIAALASGGIEDLTAGETIRSRVDAYNQYSSEAWVARHSFDFSQNGTVRFSFEQSSSSSDPAYFRVTRLRNGVTTELGSWTNTSTAWLATTLDVDVKAGDRVSLDRKATNYSYQDGKQTVYVQGYARLQNVRFKTGGENLIPGVYAPVEND